MTESEDGFVISEKDLKLRGPGEFFRYPSAWSAGAEDCRPLSGLPILKEAQAAAAELLRKDRNLEQMEHQPPESENRGIFGRKTSGNVSFFCVFSLLVVN